jgi:hypothetical protein
MVWFSAWVLALIPLAATKPLLSKRWDNFEVKHAWSEVPKGWKCHGPAPSDHVLGMRIALKQDKLEDLITALYEVSDPVHKRRVNSVKFGIQRVSSLALCLGCLSLLLTVTSAARSVTGRTHLNNTGIWVIV